MTQKLTRTNIEQTIDLFDAKWLHILLVK